jgi:hypothetical protein
VRESLQPYSGPDSFNYLCILASDLIGDTNLRRLPALLAGFDGVLATLPPAAARAVRNLRLVGCAPTTLRELRLMLDEYQQHHERRERTRRARSSERGRASDSDDEEGHGFDQRFLVDSELVIKKRWTHIVPHDVREALQSLTNRLAPREALPLPSHDGEREAVIRRKDDGFEANLQTLEFTPPVPVRYDVARRGRALSPIRWQDLVAVADRFDEQDRIAGRQGVGERSWYGRLYDETGQQTACLFAANSEGLRRTDVLNLAGVRHLIGLPGAGKTTLLYLLAAYLHERGYKACFLFPSIQVSTAFIETLSRYNVPTALLYGQSANTRSRHVANFATTLAANNNGLGATRTVAPYFATNCALAAYASDEEKPFPHSYPPCRELVQEAKESGRRRPHQCALSSVCGRQFSERALAYTRIWAGHVLSMDRRVSPLFSDQQINHFELIARTFDLLVIDECDSTQTTLDERGTPLMKLSGDDASVWSLLIDDLHGRAARGRNAFVSRSKMPAMLEMTGRFGRAAERLTARVMHVREPFRKVHERMLLTTISIIADMFDEEDETALAARNALEQVWDAAAKSVAFRSAPVGETDEAEQEPDDARDLERILEGAARLAAIDYAQMRDFHDELQRSLEVWDRDGTDSALRHIARTLKAAPGLKTSHDDVTFFEYTSLLTTVSLLVLQHFGLAPHLRMLNAQRLVGDDVFEQRASRDLRAILPESLVGRLSGVRYTLSDEGDVDISHVGFVGTPRLLASRMHALGLEEGEGPAVLLTSATSMLHKSPSFHVNVGPHYVLNRPNAGAGWSKSQYRFLPQRDPQDERRFLRFSGSRMSQRERILKTMVDQLLRGGALSEVEAALTSNDVVGGVGRKVGFVLNSYEQCRQLFDHIRAFHPHWRGRVRYLARGGEHTTMPDGALTAAEVETLGFDRSWDLLLFPMNAIGRGVNIVYRFGPRLDKAMLGSLFFLTRPHPRTESLQLMQGIVGRASEAFDRQTFSSTNDALEALRVARSEASATIKRLLRLPLSAQRLAEYAEPFVADQMIMILQTIGRAMRGDCPAFVYFVDEAWAPRSAANQADTRQTSMLVMMRSILRDSLNDPDPAWRDCYGNLYASFYHPMTNMEGLITT